MQSIWGFYILPSIIAYTEYLISLFGSLDAINNNRNILPYHKICAYLSINANMKDAISSTYNNLVSEESITSIIDMNWSEESSILHPVIAPFSIPFLHFPENIKSSSLSVLLDQLNFSTETDHESHSESFSFTISPSVTNVFEAIDALAHYYGWRTIGMIVSHSETDHKGEHTRNFCNSYIELKKTR